MRIVPNAEATLGMLRRGGRNFLGIGGDPEVLVKFARTIQIVIRAGRRRLRFVAFNNRRAPFATPPSAALSLDRSPADGLPPAGFASRQHHVSPVLSFGTIPPSTVKTNRREEDPAAGATG